MLARRSGGLFLLTFAVACHQSASSRAGRIRSATAEMRSASGVRYGTLTLEPTAAGVVRISGALTGLAPGAHGIHFHQVGQCDGAAFATAGAHVNPTGAQHGLENPRGPHAGDLPNVFANSAGQMVVDIASPRVPLSSDGPTGVFDADGTALVIHANRDDQRTDPAGNAGERIACGVITRS
jgi:superoxide dismutase, Cu-Zn family